MSKVVWTIVLTNESQNSCTLQGSPDVTFENSDGGAIGTGSFATAENFEFPLSTNPVVLNPQEEAGVSIVEAGGNSGCDTGWSVTLQPAGAEGSLSAAASADGFGPCNVSSPVAVSVPFPLDDLLSFAAGPSQVATKAASCTASETSATPAGTLDTAEATVALAVLKIANGGPCALSSIEPTARIATIDGQAKMVKGAPALAIGSAGALLPATRTGNFASSPVLDDNYGALVAVVLPKSGPGCTTATSLVLYQSTTAEADNSVSMKLPAPENLCGTPWTLPFLDYPLAGTGVPPAAGSATSIIPQNTQTIVEQAVSAVGSGSAVPAADTTGFYYGSDTNEPVVSGSFPYNEPVPSGHSDVGRYGWYGGEIGDYFHWKNCGVGVNVPVADNVNAANSNLDVDGIGVGVSGYWMLAGAGADPNYDGTAAEATAFGQVQATHAASILAANGYFTNLAIYADIENAEINGWNARWSGACGGNGGTKEASQVSASLDLAVVTGFMHYIFENTIYTAGVYCASGTSGSGWASIFGSEPYPWQDSESGPEWTYTQPTSSLATYPSGWSTPTSAAQFYGGIVESSPNRAGVWQWAGGDGVTNNLGDLDQLYADGFAGI